MCGRTLHAFQRVPAELLKHLGEQMEIPAPDIATLRALYKNRPMEIRCWRLRGDCFTSIGS